MIRISIFLLVALISLASCSASKTDPAIDKQLYDLLENKSFFKLRTELENVKDKLSKDRLLYYQAFCDHVFDKCEQSNQHIEQLLNKHKSQLNDTIICELLEVKAANYVRLYQYRDAADVHKQILEGYTHTLDSADAEDHVNSQNLWGAIAAVPPQRIHKDKDEKIAAYRNQFNHQMTPVKSCGIADEFIFDTGANLSTITESSAKKMGLTMYESEITVESSTHIKVKTKLAAADSLYVGNILFENVVFLVAPDEQLSFPTLDYYISGIIGFPVIHQMEEVRLQKDGSIVVPQKAEDKSFQNLCLEALHPIILAKSGSDTLLFTLDTGAKTTTLSKLYYEKYKEYVEKNGELGKTAHGGVGGIVEVEEYELSDFPLTIGSQICTLPVISVELDEYSYNKYYEGNMGQDVMTQFNEMILNFKYMYLDFS